MYLPAAQTSAARLGHILPEPVAPVRHRDANVHDRILQTAAWADVDVSVWEWQHVQAWWVQNQCTLVLRHRLCQACIISASGTGFQNVTQEYSSAVTQ